jgi:hypothetical protein
MTAAAVITICNGALFRMGEEYIDSGADLSTPANLTERIMGQKYARAFRSVLREHGWNSAIKRGSLTVSGTAPAFEFSKQYPLPNDYERLVAVWLGGYRTSSGWRNEGRKILTDAATVDIKYVHYPRRADYDSDGNYDTALNSFLGALDAHLQELFELKLCAETCKSFSGVATEKDRFFGEYAAALEKAKESDGLEDQPTSIWSDYYYARRF